MLDRIDSRRRIDVMRISRYDYFWSQERKLWAASSSHRRKLGRLKQEKEFQRRQLNQEKARKWQVLEKQQQKEKKHNFLIQKLQTKTRDAAQMRRILCALRLKQQQNMVKQRKQLHIQRLFKLQQRKSSQQRQQLRLLRIAAEAEELDREAEKKGGIATTRRGKHAAITVLQYLLQTSLLVIQVRALSSDHSSFDNINNSKSSCRNKNFGGGRSDGSDCGKQIDNIDAVMLPTGVASVGMSHREISGIFKALVKHGLHTHVICKFAKKSLLKVAIKNLLQQKPQQRRRNLLQCSINDQQATVDPICGAESNVERMMKDDIYKLTEFDEKVSQNMFKLLWGRYDDLRESVEDRLDGAFAELLASDPSIAQHEDESTEEQFVEKVGKKRDVLGTIKKQRTGAGANRPKKDGASESDAEPLNVDLLEAFPPAPEDLKAIEAARHICDAESRAMVGGGANRNVSDGVGKMVPYLRGSNFYLFFRASSVAEDRIAQGVRLLLEELQKISVDHTDALKRKRVGGYRNKKRDFYDAVRNPDAPHMSIALEGKRIRGFHSGSFEGVGFMASGETPLTFADLSTATIRNPVPGEEFIGVGVMGSKLLSAKDIIDLKNLAPRKEIMQTMNCSIISALNRLVQSLKEVNERLVRSIACAKGA